MTDTQIKYVKHKRSDKVDFFGNIVPPKASGIEIGEIAMNYSAGNETLFIKNSDGEVVAFPTHKDIVTMMDAMPSFTMKVECDDGTSTQIQVLKQRDQAYGYYYGGDTNYYNIGEWDE